MTKEERLKGSINFGDIGTEKIKKRIEEVKQKDHAELSADERLDKSINFGDLNPRGVINTIERIKIKEQEFDSNSHERYGSINFGDLSPEMILSILKESKRRESISKAKQKLIRNKEILQELSAYNRGYKKRKPFLANRIDTLINKYEENENIDPNLSEYIEVAGDTNRYLAEKKDSYEELIKVYYGIKKLGALISNRMLDKEITIKNSPLHGMITEATEKAISGEPMYSLTSFINKNIVETAEKLALAKREYRETNKDIDLDIVSEEEFNRLSFLIKLGQIAELGVNMNRKKLFQGIKKWYTSTINIEGNEELNTFLPETQKAK